MLPLRFGAIFGDDPPGMLTLGAMFGVHAAADAQHGHEVGIGAGAIIGRLGDVFIPGGLTPGIADGWCHRNNGSGTPPAAPGCWL